MNPNNHSQALYDAEAKATLKQVEQDLNNKRSQIIWVVLKPNKFKNPEGIRNRTRIGHVIGIIFTSFLWWWLDDFVLDHMIKKEYTWLYYGFFLFNPITSLLLDIQIGKNIQNAPKHDAMAVHLDLMSQTVAVYSNHHRYSYSNIYKFHTKSLVQIKLPAFILPNSEASEYRLLAQKLQRKISDLTGLGFDE